LLSELYLIYCPLGRLNIMNFQSKLTIAIATATAAATICPIAASAEPTTGSTAATVSIKFQKSGATSGGYTIVPGGNANGGGNGVKELSAAVATGETDAHATSASNYAGTSATATGFSKPVFFKYSNTSDISNITKTVDLATTTKTQKDSASQSANSQDGFTKTASSKNSESANGANAQQAAANQSANSQDGSGNSASGKNSESANANNIAAAGKAKATGTQGTNINLGGVNSSGAGGSEVDVSASASGSNSAKASETASNNFNQKNSASQSANSNSSSGNTASGKAAETASLDTAQKNAANQSASTKDGADNTLKNKTGDTTNTTKTNLNYEYSGSSAGLSFIPANK
jgi:hypothetical protein